MSSIVTIIPCKFTDYNPNNVITRLIEDSISYGYRIYDDRGSSYNNLWEKEDITLSPIEILKKVYKDHEGNDTLILMFDFIIEEELGIFVGNDWLEWNQIRSVLT